MEIGERAVDQLRDNLHILHTEDHLPAAFGQSHVDRFFTVSGHTGQFFQSLGRDDRRNRGGHRRGKLRLADRESKAIRRRHRQLVFFHLHQHAHQHRSRFISRCRKRHLMDHVTEIT